METLQDSTDRPDNRREPTKSIRVIFPISLVRRADKKCAMKGDRSRLIREAVEEKLDRMDEEETKKN